MLRSMPVVFVLIWSTGFIVSRYGMPHAPPMKFLAIRYALSVACFLVWARATGARWPANRREYLHLAVVGLLIQAGYLGGVWAAIKAGMGAGLSALLVGLQPVLTAIWVSGRGGRVAALQWVGLALGLAGLALVVWQKLGYGEVNTLNLTYSAIALFSITAGTLYQKRYVAPGDVRTSILVQMLAAFVVTAPLALLETEAMRWSTDAGGVNIELVGAMAWSVLALTLGASSLYYLLVQRGAALTVSSVMYLVPPTTALMAWLLFSEPITPLIIAGIALTAFGVSLVLRHRD
jgi:drug/metabolite transporter (DMT)-like permease